MRVADEEDDAPCGPTVVFIKQYSVIHQVHLEVCSRLSDRGEGAREQATWSAAWNA
jgi:hypothetical protein